MFIWLRYFLQKAVETVNAEEGHSVAGVDGFPLLSSIT